MNIPIIERFKLVIKEAEDKNLFRSPTKNNCISLDFSNNDYLCLSHNSSVISAGYEAALKYGAGSTGSRLLSGNYELIEDFESQIAIDKKFPCAMIFSSGYQLNTTVLNSIVGKDTIVIFDKLNHASCYDGVLSKCKKIERYSHLEYNELEDILHKNLSEKEKIIVSESVFGMDGDKANLKILSNLANKYGAMLYIDEAHSTGLYGKKGYGLSTMYELDAESTIVMGTFSKAIGSSGAYLVCSKTIKDFLYQKCRGMIYSTSPSPFCIGAAKKAWGIIPSMDNIRIKILQNSQYLRDNINNKDHKILGYETNITSVIFNNTEQMLDVKNILSKNNIIVSAIRKPTSPTPRLRIAVNALHTLEQITQLASFFK